MKKIEKCQVGARKCCKTSVPVWCLLQNMRFSQFMTNLKKSIPEWLSKDLKMNPKWNRNRYKGGGKERKEEEGERKGDKGRRKGMQGEKRNKREVRGVKGGCPVATAANRRRFILPWRGGPYWPPARESLSYPDALGTYVSRWQFSHRLLMTFWTLSDAQSPKSRCQNKPKLFQKVDPKMKRK